MIDEATFRSNLARIEERIAAACSRAGRARKEVTLVAVSKLQPAEAIEVAWKVGVRHFGENYAQELRDKHAQLGSTCPGIHWHAIGPVQTKNAKYLARAANTFHAVERLEVAEELSRRREGAPLECLIEVNVGAEDTKAGVAPSEVPGLVKAIRALPHLQLVGLTAMPPLSDDPEAARPYFKALAKLARVEGLTQLSMGTTSDFEAAIEEGATMIRVGTALFGQRPTK